MSYLKYKVINHRQRVCRLYKACLRNLKSYYWDEPAEYRYHAVVMRARFDEHKNETDLRKAKQLIINGEHALKQQLHPQPLFYPESPGGTAYDREFHWPDRLLDSWHPLEKKMYPKYFARREQRKKEYIERWQQGFYDPELAEKSEILDSVYKPNYDPKTGLPNVKMP